MLLNSGTDDVWYARQISSYISFGTKLQLTKREWPPWIILLSPSMPLPGKALAFSVSLRKLSTNVSMASDDVDVTIPINNLKKRGPPLSSAGNVVKRLVT